MQAGRVCSANISRRRPVARALLSFLVWCAGGLVGTVAVAQDVAPGIVSVWPAPGEVPQLTNVQVVFSVPVVGVTPTDLLINGIPAQSVQGSGLTWTFQFDQPTYGPVKVGWDAGHGIVGSTSTGVRFQDTAAGSSWEYLLVDHAAPFLLKVSPSPEVIVRGLSEVEITFSEVVSGVDAADLLVNGSPAQSLVDLGRGRYQFRLAASPPGAVVFSWSATHGIQDLAASANGFAGGSWSVTVNPASPVPGLRINEVMAWNVSGLKDEDGEPQDWIELHNPGTEAVNMAGWSLSDDSDDLGRWVFPATNINPGEFLVVYASAKDRRIAGARLHTNFRLNSSGDYLALCPPDFPRQPVHAFSPEFPGQRPDMSYGADMAGNVGYFEIPTPGFINSAAALKSVTALPHVNVTRGIFQAPITLFLTHPSPAATIRFTTNGSEPTLAAGEPYTGPIRIATSTVLKAAAFEAAHVPSLSITHTYLFPASTINQNNNPPNCPVDRLAWSGLPPDYEMDPQITSNAAYSGKMLDSLRALPALSIVISSNDLFGLAPSGPGAGIYTHPLARGPAWERPCSTELITTDGTPGFHINCGVQIQGNANREPTKQPKHSFRLVFKGDFGPARLRIPVFPDSPLAEFDSLVLRADFNNSWLHWSGLQRARGQRIRDAWMKDTFRAMGGLASHSRFVHLYLNGLYWGIYDITERPDAAFAAGYLGGNKSDYDVIRPEPLEAVDGDLTGYQRLIGLTNLVDSAQFDLMRQHLDMVNFIDYTLLHFFTGHEDWGNTKNWYAIRPRTPGGAFQFIPWDGERILEGLSDNIIAQTDQPGGLHPRVLHNPEYRVRFADRAHKHLFNAGALTPAANRQRWQVRSGVMDTAIIAESARWGDYRRDVHPYSEGPYELYERDQQYRVEQDRLLNSYFPARTSNFVQQLRIAGLYPLIEAPVFNHAGGRVAPGFLLTISNPNADGVILYTKDGSDPRVPYAGSVSPGALTYTAPIEVAASGTIRARILAGTNWSALHEVSFNLDPLGLPLRVTEIMYHPPGGDAYEYLRIQNVGSRVLDLSKYSLEGVTFVFPLGTTLLPGQSLILGSDAATEQMWTSRYPGLNRFGTFSGTLDDGGEKLEILDAARQVVGWVYYDDERGWPAAADGSGPSLVLVNILGNPDDAANWDVQIPPAGLTRRIRINEVAAAGQGQSNNTAIADWIELLNTGSEPVDLSGWGLSDDSNPRKFIFPTNSVVEPGQHVLVFCDHQTNAPDWHAPFALDRQGETVSLFNPNGLRIDAVTFGFQIPGFTIGRVDPSPGWLLNLPTPAQPNVAAELASPTNVVINEWVSNPLPGQPPWIELFNRNSNSPVSLAGLWISHGSALVPLPSAAFIAPGGFVQLFADNGPGPDHLDFVLSPTNGFISLFDQSGKLLSKVVYGPSVAGISQGRLPDGSVYMQRFPASSTPGTSNYRPDYSGPMLNELLALNHTSLTNAPQTAGFIELFNSATVPYDLSGMRIGLATQPLSAFVFGPGTILGPGAYLLVWCDETQPRQTSSTWLSTGWNLPEDGSTLLLSTPSGQVVDWVQFGFQAPDYSLGRGPFGWMLLTRPSPGATNAPAIVLGAPADIRINEWMADPAAGADWVELFNSSPLPIRLDALKLSDQPIFVDDLYTFPAQSYLPPRGYLRLHADGQVADGPDHLPFSLSADGESVSLATPAGVLLDAVYFGAQAEGVSQGRLLDGSTNLSTFPVTASPGAPNYQPSPHVIVNEVLPQALSPFEMAVELYNPTSHPADISGWYLSDTDRNFQKLRLPSGTVIAPGEFLVLYQQLFENSSSPFTFPDGAVFLSAVDAAGLLTGAQSQVRFGSRIPNLAFGRVYTSVGSDFAPLKAPSFGISAPSAPAEFRAGTGAWNPDPAVGPVVINEIMYHPPDAISEVGEFVELYNFSPQDIALFDEVTLRPWRLSGAVEFMFPPGLLIPAGGFAVIVGFDPATSPAEAEAFRSQYGLAPGVPLLGPFSGRLDNSGETIELLAPYLSGSIRTWHSIDRITYRDSSPWPVAADGGGQSLQRRAASGYANEPLNWGAAFPTAGSSNLVSDSFAPVIVLQPLARAVLPNTQVLLAVAAAGTQPLAFQWFRGGVAIPEETNAVLVVESATAEYHVRVTNVAGSTLSTAARIELSTVDVDGDGIPDLWEISNGLSPANPQDASSDWDGDGASNLHEYLAGTDPRNAQSALRLAIAYDGQVRLQVQVPAGKAGVVQARSDLTTGAWDTWAELAPAATNQTIVLRPGSAAAGFFRLKLQPSP